MPLINTYATGSSYESSRYSTKDELLQGIPNNTNNLIDARDVRDSVYTLWERLEETDYNVSLLSMTPSTFENSTPTTISVGGVEEGTIFNTPKTLQELFDLIFYPYIQPVCTLTISPTKKEFGATTSTLLTYNIEQKSNEPIHMYLNGPVSSYTVDVSGGSTNGIEILDASINMVVNMFTMSVYDGQTTTTPISVSLTWMNKMYYGTIDLSSYGNYNLTLNPSAVSTISSIIDNSDILSLSGDLVLSKTKTLTNVNGDGGYLIYAWPSNFAGAYNPTFTMNGLQNSAFSRIKTNWDFTNQYGYITSYEVWISNTPYNGIVNEIKII